MNRYTNKSLLLVMAAAGLAGCADEDLVNGPGRDTVKIVARMAPTVQTRTCVGGPGIDGTSTGVLWSPGDTIGVFGDSGTRNAGFVNQSTANVAEATFAGQLGAGERPQYAYYPYSPENASASATAIAGTLPMTQRFDMTSGRLEGDYKVGTPTRWDEDGSEFTFTHLFSLLRFTIDATGTPLEGERLESITLTLPDGRQLGGSFTVDATAGGAVDWTSRPEAANVLTMDWTDRPVLESGASYTGYITCAPDVHEGDEIQITVRTTQFEATFTREALMDFTANSVYTFPLTLSLFNDMEVKARPVFTSFVFAAAANESKILGKRLVNDGLLTKVIDVAGDTLAIDGTTVSGCIPYLYRFDLAPTFATPEGVTVTVDGVEQVSGTTVQDFSQPVTYTLSNGEQEAQFTVEVKNTGLPVVVLEQEGEGDTRWDAADLMVYGKEAEWAKTDKVSVYEADGTVNVDRVDAGFRLRGNSTQEYPKLPFAIKFDKKQSVLGMPKHKRWVLLANWMDRTMLRNAVAFEIAHRTAGAFNDGLGWNPRGTNVEVVYNGRHVGNYYLCEQIKIDGDRLDIKDCYEDVVEDMGEGYVTPADCGYLLEFDDGYDENCKFITNRRYLPCQLKDDVPWESSSAFRTFVEDKVNGVEDALADGDYARVYELLDMNSVIDQFFVWELTMNNEYRHPKSLYMYIDGDSKLFAGPVWDFDFQTFPNEENIVKLRPEYGITTGGNTGLITDLPDFGEWMYASSAPDAWEWGDWWVEKPSSPDKSDAPYMWYPLLFKDASFRQRVQERWATIYPALLSVAEEIRQLGEANRLSDRFNEAMWPLDGASRKGGNPQLGYLPDVNGDERMTYDEAIRNLEAVFSARLAGLNSLITSGSFVTDAK